MSDLRQCGCGAPVIVAAAQNGTGATVVLDAAPLDPPGYLLHSSPRVMPVAVVARTYRRHECARRAAA